MLVQLLALASLIMATLGDPCQTHIAELATLFVLDRPKCAACPI